MRYDAMNRLVTVTDGAKVTTYAYDKNGNRGGAGDTHLR